MGNLKEIFAQMDPAYKRNIEILSQDGLQGVHKFDNWREGLVKELCQEGDQRAIEIFRGEAEFQEAPEVLGLK